MGGLVQLLSAVLLLAEWSHQQDPDRFQLEQDPRRFQMEHEPDRFQMEHEPDRFQMEHEPDRFQMEHEPDRFQMEQEPPDRFQMEQDPDRLQMEQESPDKLSIQEDPDRLRFEQTDNGRTFLQAAIKHSRMESEGDKFERKVVMQGDDDFRRRVGMQDEDDDDDLERRGMRQGDDDFQRRVAMQGDDDFRRRVGMQDEDDDLERQGMMQGDDDFERRMFREMATQQGKKNLDSFRSAAMGDDNGDDDNLLDELADLQKEKHTNPHKGPKTKKKPKKVTFQENVDMKAMVERISREEITESEGDGDDKVLSQWVMVTSEGYEYTAEQEDIEKVLRESGLPAATSGYTESSFDVGEEQMRMQASINASSQRVLGYDSRRMISYPWYYPFSAMGRVLTGCSGAFIGPNHILTAGHCVYNPYRRTWYRSMNFQRRKNCYPNRGVYYTWKNAVTVVGWIRGYRAYDYAVIVVRQRSPTWMGFGYRSPMPRYYVATAGYPYDKSRQCLWRSYGYLDRRYYNWMTHRCDTYNGMSGAPIYVGYRIYGIHVGSYGYTRNLAVRINKRRYRTLLYIMRYYR